MEQKKSPVELVIPTDIDRDFLKRNRSIYTRQLRKENCFNPLLACTQEDCDVVEVRGLNLEWFNSLKLIRGGIVQPNLQLTVRGLERIFKAFQRLSIPFNHFLGFEGIFAQCHWFYRNGEQSIQDVIFYPELDDKGRILAPSNWRLFDVRRPKDILAGAFGGIQDRETQTIGALGFENPFAQILQNKIEPQTFKNAHEYLRNAELFPTAKTTTDNNSVKTEPPDFGHEISEDDLRKDLLKYHAETQRLVEENAKRVVRESRYGVATEWQDEEAFIQFYTDKIKTDDFFKERERIERKMLIELYEKQGIPNAAEVADERLRRLDIEARMQLTEMLGAMNAQKQDGMPEPRAEGGNGMAAAFVKADFQRLKKPYEAWHEAWNNRRSLIEIKDKHVTYAQGYQEACKEQERSWNKLLDVLNTTELNTNDGRALMELAKDLDAFRRNRVINGSVYQPGQYTDGIELQDYERKKYSLCHYLDRFLEKLDDTEETKQCFHIGLRGLVEGILTGSHLALFAGLENLADVLLPKKEDYEILLRGFPTGCVYYLGEPGKDGFEVFTYLAGRKNIIYNRKVLPQEAKVLSDRKSLSEMAGETILSCYSTMNRDDKDRAGIWIDRLKMESVRMEIQAQQIANQKAATESAVDNSPGLKAAEESIWRNNFKKKYPSCSKLPYKIQITYSEITNSQTASKRTSDSWETFFGWCSSNQVEKTEIYRILFYEVASLGGWSQKDAASFSNGNQSNLKKVWDKLKRK